MKKQLLFITASVLSVYAANAQITVTQSDMPVVGKVVTEANDTVFAGITPGTSGTNQTWNFSNLLNHTQDVTGTVVPATLTGSGNFPTATIAGTNPVSQQDVYIYSDASTFNILGVYGNIGGSVTALKFNPALKKLTLPSTYNTTYNGSYTFNLVFAYTSYPGIDSVKMSSSVNYTSVIDGWGTITTPAFSNVASIRQKYTDITTTTNYMKGSLTGGVWTATGSPTVDTTNTYDWWSNVKQWSIAEIQTNASGTTTGAKYLLSMQNGGVGVLEVAQKENAISVYPNPASDNIHISGLTETSYFVVSDVTGKIVGATLLKNSANTYSVSNFNTGIYFYQAIGLNGNVIGKGKFVVTK